MQKFKLYDTNFSHTRYKNYNICRPNSFFEWDRDIAVENVKPSDTIFFTDRSIFQAHLYNAKKIAWIIEPCEKNSEIHNWIIQHHTEFDHVLTYEKSLLDLGKNFEYYVAAGCWIEEADTKIWEKSKLTSTVLSNKQATEHHKFRHFLKHNGNYTNVDAYGTGGNIPLSIDSGKIDSLKDYMFHIVIDQSMVEYGFTEKIIDCFATGTIPIYRGVENVKRYFNTDGILFFKTAEELEAIKMILTPELYHSKKAAILDNFNRSKEYFVCEDWLYKNFMKLL